jgi:hypothetical protein
VPQRGLDLNRSVLSHNFQQPRLRLVSDLALKSIQQTGWIEVAELLY